VQRAKLYGGVILLKKKTTKLEQDSQMKNAGAGKPGSD
jgi:hypothetical protein